MASMGDDQEENIEMWKIKKVRVSSALERSFFLLLLLFIFGCVCVCVGESPDDDDDGFLIFFFTRSLCLTCKRAKRRERTSSLISFFLFSVRASIR